MGRKITNTCWPTAGKKKIHQLGDLLKLLMLKLISVFILASTIYESFLSTIGNLFQRVKIESEKKIINKIISRENQSFFFLKMTLLKISQSKEVELDRHRLNSQ